MFQLIVVTISIALAAVLAIAAIFYGGDAFATASDKNKYNAYMNAAGQISASLALYQNQEHKAPTETNGALLQMLMDGNYLKSIPEGDWVVSANELYRPLDVSAGESQCIALNKAAGQDTDPAFATTPCPVCGEEATKDWPGCQVTTPSSAPSRG